MLLQNPVILQWLLHACQAVLEDKKALSEAATGHRLQWPASSENSWQHLRLAAYSDNEAALPQEELQVVL